MHATRTPTPELAPTGVRLADVLDLERVEDDLFRSVPLFAEAFSLFGGQVAAQALMAAGRTVAPERRPHSLHGYFLRPGDSRRPVVFSVARDRDGRSFSARRVVALQDGAVILNLSASFALEDPTDADETAPGFPAVAPPGELQHPPRLIGIEQSLPAQPHRVHSYPIRAWLRCVEDLPPDPLLDAAVLTYLSDIYTGNGSLTTSGGRSQSTLDHAVWFHRPALSGGWVLMDLQAGSASRGRGHYTGRLWTEDGVLVASLAQETLYREHR